LVKRVILEVEGGAWRIASIPDDGSLVLYSDGLANVYDGDNRVVEVEYPVVGVVYNDSDPRFSEVLR
jgi:hypothetical protein